jgi:hypothetical protein
MAEQQRTTRQQIAEQLRERPLDPSAIAREFELSANQALTHVEHIARSVDSTDEDLLVAPPECRDCGFDAYDDLVNRPSRCPECHSESIAEPAFRID